MEARAGGNGGFHRDGAVERKPSGPEGAEHEVQVPEVACHEEREPDAKPVAIPLLRERLARHKVDLGRYESFAPELVRFSAPPHLSADHAELVVKIVVLDHRSLHAFGAHSSARAEVKALLQNAVITAGYQLVGSGRKGPSSEPVDALPAIGLCAQAEEVFVRHLQARNRLRYLMGVAIGILFLVGVAFAVQARLLPDGLEQAIELKLLPTIIFFAGLGSIVSVLLRLSRLDVVKEISRSVLAISGMGRPFVASAFALVIYIAISNKLIAVSIGTGDQIGAYLVLAFLCGFSERYATDLLERVEGPRESHRSE